MALLPTTQYSLSKTARPFQNGFRNPITAFTMPSTKALKWPPAMLSAFCMQMIHSPRHQLCITLLTHSPPLGEIKRGLLAFTATSFPPTPKTKSSAPGKANLFTPKTCATAGLVRPPADIAAPHALPPQRSVCKTRPVRYHL